ncbi:MAG: NAD-dependent epimerase/dehydratase family protein [Lachnospiraceae bacterium]|nr:NAD-dependent epimerase/dehydratase family protein [Lachnospiraceae bacterium]
MADKIWSEDKILQEDLERIAASEMIDWEMLRDKRILVTGATGLIGSLAARALVCASVKRSLNLQVAALVRSPEKGKAMLGAFLEDGLELVTGDILSPVAVDGPVDYILHGASVTTSKDFVDHPVETILTTLKGTEHLLELARQKQVMSMVYFSSMEIYGVPDAASYMELGRRQDVPGSARMAAVLREADYGYIDPLQVRSSYSEGKRMAEGLCAAYAHEYQVPVKMVRLAQTFGAGIPKNENRVFAQFARSIMEGKDIVLHTDGSKAHCYCYTTDAVLGILTVLLRGTDGEAYNISNEETYSTIRGMAEMLIEKYPQSGSRLVFDIPEDANQYGYAPTSRMLICSEKARALGWRAQVTLPEMFERLMGSMENS